MKEKNQKSALVYTVDDVADLLQLSPRTIRRLIAAGKIKVIRFGGAIRIPPSEVDAILDSGVQ
jgi:excisionase family DNA binding protein